MKMIPGISVNLLFILAAFLLISGDISAKTQPLPVEAFSSLPRIKNMRISPNGKKLIYFQNAENSTYLVSLDLATYKLTTITIVDNEKFKFRFADWANNEKVIFSVAVPYHRSGVPVTETRLLVRSADASDESRELVNAGAQKASDPEYESQFQDNIISMLPDDPKHILIALDLREPGSPGVHKINVDTRDITEVQHYKRDVRDWSADQQGRVRVGLRFNSGTTTVTFILYDIEEEKWRDAWTSKPLSNDPAVEPMGFGLDPNILYVRSDHNGRNAIFKVDVRDPELTLKLVAKDDTYDINGKLIYSQKTRDVIGVYHGEADGRRIYWDEFYKKFQEAVDKALPGTINYLIDFSEDESKYIVYSTSDKVPGTYYLGDSKEKTLKLLSSDYPQLDGKLQGNKKVTYSARDGQAIEAYLTLPADHKPGVPSPAIILPHGGPMVRDYGDFDYWAEFFASRGIVVLQPNFRGSSGYGRDFERQAIQNFGLTMQDDLTDAANWLIEEKLALPDRIAITGGSYGGYAALMGAVKTPDLFRCAISFAGISDLYLLVKSKQFFLNYGVVLKQLGSDRKKLKAVSPLEHVDKIKIPVLLGHGDKDRTVPVEQSRKMAKELKKMKKKYTYIELENGGHGLNLQKNRHEFFKAMDKFLNKYLLK